MPTYEYKCTGCGHRFEKFQSINSESLRICPACGENKVVRLLTGGGGLIFKGSGFYATDYKSQKSDDAKPKADKTTETKKEKE